MLHIKDLSLSLGKHRILDQVSLHAEAGELCVIMGANGAGKSTLLKVVAGEYEGYTGSVTLTGKEVRDIPSAMQARTRAVLSQQLSLKQPFKVAEVVAMGRYVHNTKADTAIIAYAMKTLQVYELRNRAYTTLSGGQQQRVQMARVLAQLLEEPNLHARDKMLLLDEPVTGMDILHQQQALQLAATLATQGALVIAVLHDFQLAAAYASRIMLLKNGQLFASGTPAEVLTAENIKACFGVDVAILNHPECHYPLVVTSNLLLNVIEP
jgi:iron complex transport system ATP-binding protein